MQSHELYSIALSFFIFSRAFGKAETASASLALQHRVAPQISGDAMTNSKRLKELESRIEFPEMRSIAKATDAPVALQSADDTDSQSLNFEDLPSAKTGKSPRRKERHSRDEPSAGGEVINIPNYFNGGNAA